jgi:glycerol uptake facilitator-like aquaporin
MKTNLARRMVAEGLGTAILLATVVGSGIMAERLAGGNVAVALLANTIATGAALFALILTLGGISGAHFNPAVTICDCWQSRVSKRNALAYITVQIAGSFAGVAVANVMFELPVFFASQKIRTGFAQWFSDFVATFGLLAVIWGCIRLRSATVVPFAVAAYIIAACWFTASTSFANPAVTLARSMSDSFARIRLIDVPAFIVAQFLGAIAATLLFHWLVPITIEDAETVIIPHEEKQNEKL